MAMKGYYKRISPDNRWHQAKLYSCNHPLYSKCTLFIMEGFDGYGLAVIQQRFNPDEKITWWGPIDPWLTNDITITKGFTDFFIRHAGIAEDTLYPTIELRKLMYALHMKPLPKRYWEVKLDSQKLRLL